MGQRLVVLVVVMVGLVVSSAAVGAAPPPDLVCGQVITTDVVLRTDLTCDGDGLIIGASGVTAKLGGHTITSTNGTGMGIQLTVPGVKDSPCVGDVEIRGGTITGFFAGISSPRHCRVGLRDYTTGRVRGSTLTGNTWGVYLYEGYRLSVDGTTIVGPNGISGPVSSDAIGTGSTGTVELTRSTVEVTSPTGYSVYSERTGTPFSTIASSRLEGGQFRLDTNGHVIVTKSRLTDVRVECRDAYLGVSDSRITRGSIVGFYACGFGLDRNRVVGPGSGTAVAARGAEFGLRVTDNVFTGWDTAITLEYSDSTITGNTFRRNGVGVSCVSGTGWCGFGTVSGNSFVENTGTGLQLRAGTWRPWNVGGNTALRNGGLGIDASGPLLIDDGGNIARRNLDPQCVGVVCTPHPEPPAP